MKERPIIFNSGMVQAILAERKTQTRRVMKPQPEHIEGNMYKWRKWLPFLPQDAFLLAEHCPHGVIGDRLWVRETWFPMQDIEACVIAGEPITIAYKADYDAEGVSREEAREVGIDRWRPSILMPRWASRITLEVTGVRVERVQDISEEAARAEGIIRRIINRGPKSNPVGIYPAFPEKEGGFHTARDAFEALWDSINAKPRPVERGEAIVYYVSYPWDESSRDSRTKVCGLPHYCYPNPWVWVVEFKICV